MEEMINLFSKAVRDNPLNEVETKAEGMAITTQSQPARASEIFEKGVIFRPEKSTSVRYLGLC